MGSEMTTQHTAKGGKIKVELYYKDGIRNMVAEADKAYQEAVGDLPY